MRVTLLLVVISYSVTAVSSDDAAQSQQSTLHSSQVTRGRGEPSHRLSREDEQDERDADDHSTQSQVWSPRVTDGKSKSKKPAYTLVRPLWMDPRDTWRALQQNDEAAAVRRAAKRNKQVQMIAKRLSKSFLKMQTSFVAFRWNLQTTHSLTEQLSPISWSRVSIRSPHHLSRLIHFIQAKGAGSFEFCGSNSTSSCRSADGASFISPSGGLYQVHFSGMFTRPKAREDAGGQGEGAKCPGCRGERRRGKGGSSRGSITINICLDNSCTEAGIVSMAPVLGKTFHGSAWGLLWLERGQTVSVFLSKTTSSPINLKRSGTFFAGLLVRQAPRDTPIKR